MKKPELQPEHLQIIKSFYYYLDCIDYMQEKYKDDKEFDADYLWEHLSNYLKITNDSYFDMNTDTRFTTDYKIAYAKDLIEKEFGDGSGIIKFYICW